MNSPITGMRCNVLTTWVPTNTLYIMFMILDYVCEMTYKKRLLLRKEKNFRIFDSTIRVCLFRRKQASKQAIFICQHRSVFEAAVQLVGDLQLAPPEWYFQNENHRYQGTHLPTSEGWTAELTVGLWKVVPSRFEPTTSRSWAERLDYSAIYFKHTALMLLPILR